MSMTLLNLLSNICFIAMIGVLWFGLIGTAKMLDEPTKIIKTLGFVGFFMALCQMLISEQLPVKIIGMVFTPPFLMVVAIIYQDWEKLKQAELMLEEPLAQRAIAALVSSSNFPVDMAELHVRNLCLQTLTHPETAGNIEALLNSIIQRQIEPDTGFLQSSSNSCEYFQGSIYMRCAVHPELKTCEGCKDYVPKG